MNSPCRLAEGLLALSMTVAPAACPAAQTSEHPIVIRRWLAAESSDGSVSSFPSHPPASPYALLNTNRLLWGEISADASGKVVLGPATGAVKPAEYYAYCEIFSPTGIEAAIHIQASCPLGLWLNGERLYWKSFQRAPSVADHVHCRLNKGYNRLLLGLSTGAGKAWFRTALSYDRQVSLRWIVPLTGDRLLEEIERRTVEFFIRATEDGTGLTRDSYPVASGAPESSPASVAASGFYLTALCIADSRGWLSRHEALHRARTTLQSYLEKVEGTNGFFYHFVDPATGKRVWNSEVSSIDTALLLAGALTARNYFSDPQLTEDVNRLYGRVNWHWMLNGADLLSMGWKPESGFIQHRWNAYSEHTLLYLLAMGAPHKPLDSDTWYLWKRPVFTYGGRTYIQAVPLFQHQYPHCWIDFRRLRDAKADYFLNSRLATLAHREYCLSLRDRFPAYSPILWGVTASLGPTGYMVWGGPPPTQEYPIDGTVVPCASAGSLPFAPRECLAVLEEIVNHYSEQAWTPLGFVDAFNPATGWRAPMLLSIDQGAVLLMAENLRSGSVWEWFMQGPEMERALGGAGFVSHGRYLEPADQAYLWELASNTWACIAHFVHPTTGLPYDSSDRDPMTSASNIGLYLASLVAARDLGFLTYSEAVARAGAVLDSLEALSTWKGFRQCWHSVEDLSPATNDTMISLVDSANLAMGMLVAAHGFDSLECRFRQLVNDMQWEVFYDPEAGLLRGGYDLAKNVFPSNWYVDLLASDARSAAFLAVALGGVPLDAWLNLKRDLKERFHVNFYGPGREGGGLFMQYLPGIFLPEQGTCLGRSAANLAYADIIHARQIGAPVWGWSSCCDPQGGYLGWGSLRDEVVSPHASVLAIEDFAREVLGNLLRLRQMKADREWTEGTNSFCFGFRDSINWETGEVADRYLILDQCMLFLALANYLDRDLIRRYLLAEPRIARTLEKLPEFAARIDPETISIFDTEAELLIRREPRLREIKVPVRSGPITVDGDLSEWPAAQGREAAGRIRLAFPEDSEMGRPLLPRRFAADAAFSWDTGHLYLAVSVADDELMCDFPARELYKGDCIELYVDPHCDGFYWGKPSDYQIGISPSGPAGAPQCFAWFQNTVPTGLICSARVTTNRLAQSSYDLEVAIPWQALGMSSPEAGDRICASIAVHTTDRELKHSAKLNWSYVPQPDHVKLGSLMLQPAPAEPVPELSDRH